MDHIASSFPRIQRNQQEDKALKLRAIEPKAKKLKALKHRIKTKLKDDSDSSDLFYYKVLWRLSEAQIWSIVERAESARDPKRYFLSACKSEMS